MNAVYRLISTALAAVLIASGAVRSDAADDRPPPMNVVMIVADDLGWADLGCYGADFHDTSHLDQLAADGVRFTAAYAASVCSPTRASLMTGKHYARLRTTIWREAALSPPQDRRLIPPLSAADLPHSEVTVAEAFQTAGYRTALVGKWHLGDAGHYPETQGFDVNIGGTLWGAPQSYFYPYRGAARFGGEVRYVPHLEGGSEGEYLTDRLTDESLKIIDSADGKPLFLCLCHHAVHTPIEAPDELIQRYQEKLKPGLRHRNPKYAAMVHTLDQSVGRVLAHLQKRRIAERTIVVFVSDNGGHVGQFDDVAVTDNYPLRSGKGSLYEGGVRVPLIVRAPGTTSAGCVCDEPVYAADLFPTLLELAGVPRQPPAAERADATSLVPLLHDPAARLGRDELYFHYPHYYATTTPASAIRARQWKLIEYYEDRHVELYNLQDDIGEKHNVAHQMPAKATDLRQRLAGWLQQVDALMPTPNEAWRERAE